MFTPPIHNPTALYIRKQDTHGYTWAHFEYKNHKATNIYQNKRNLKFDPELPPHYTLRSQFWNEFKMIKKLSNIYLIQYSEAEKTWSTKISKLNGWYRRTECAIFQMHLVQICVVTLTCFWLAPPVSLIISKYFSSFLWCYSWCMSHIIYRAHQWCLCII